MTKDHVTAFAAMAFGAVVLVSPGVSARAEHANAQEREARTTELRAKANEAREAAQVRVEERKKEVAEKLQGKRLEACERHEVNINRILDKSAKQSEKKLEVARKIEDRVKDFYEAKKLNLANYDALTVVVDEKEDAAVAAIEAVEATEYDCTAEGEKKEIGALISSSMKSQNAAVREYRVAVKDLLREVKQSAKAAEAEKTEDTTEENESTTEGAQQ